MTNTLLTNLSSDKLGKYYASGFWKDDTVYQLARAHAAAAPDRIAVRERARVTTYGHLVAKADALADDLRAAGVRAGQRVAAWMPSRVETLVVLLACSRNGYVCCPSLHRNHTVGEIAELMRRMRAAALVAEIGYGADGTAKDIFRETGGLKLARSYALAPLHGALQAPVRVRDPDEPSPVRELPNGADAPAAADAGEADANGVLYLAFTSGTTGEPKGVMHSDNTLLANARAIVADWDLGRHSVIYTLSPLSHNLGFGALITALLVGAELVCHDLPSGASLLDRIVETGTTYMVGVPAHAIDLLSELRRRPGTQIPALKGFRISGAAVPRNVVAELLQHGIVPQSGYGMTEACSHHYTHPKDDPELIINSSGRACDGYEIRIWSKEDPEIEVPAGTVGQIGGRGASLMLGYFDNQAASEDSFNGQGWFMTGDLGWVDEAGYLRITGRKKDIIIRGGHNIYPAHIEALAMRHPAVERVAAFPVPDERLGEKVCIAVMPVKGARVAADDLLAHLDAEGLSKFDMPEFFMELEDIPLTASGKVMKRAVQDMVDKETVTPLPVRWSPSGAKAERLPELQVAAGRA